MNYNILWIDDSPDWVESIRGSIEEFIQDNGYAPNIELLEEAEKVDGYIDRPDLDLIIVDYQLPGINGDQLIVNIRNKGKFLEIVFYSQDAQPEQVIGPIDGVFHSTRDDAEEKIKQVIELTLRKTRDLEIVRGLIIAESIDIENILEKIMIKIFDNKADIFEERVLGAPNVYDFSKKTQFVTGYVKDLISNNNSEIESTKGNGGEELREKNTLLIEIKTILDVIEKEVLDQRNILAHSKKTYIDDGNIRLEGINKRTKHLDFNDGWLNELRQNLAKHRDNLNKLLETV